MQLILDPSSADDYRTFLKVKALPKYTVTGHSVEFPDEYADRLGVKVRKRKAGTYAPPDWYFDYQGAITAHAIRKQKFAGFIEPGLGKTPMILEFAKHALSEMRGKRSVLIVSPLMVVRQTMGEAKRFYGDYPIEQVKAAGLVKWLKSGEGIGITNYEAITDDVAEAASGAGALLLDESSLLKSHYGKWGVRLIEMGKGLEWKLSMTGTPAPNDRIEYANQAVFLDAFTSTNAFLARFFVNRGQTNERWEMKAHALEPFYRALSHWSIFLTNPATYGWKDNTDTIPAIHVNIHDVDLTEEQHDCVRTETGELFCTAAGGIVKRGTLGQIAKGQYKGRAVATNKPAFIRDLVETWREKESTIIWCRYNAEQETIANVFPGCANIAGDTPHEEREELIEAFKAGQIKELVSKPEILGFGLNLQRATRQVFSTCADSYEEYAQAVKRSNRIGSTMPLNVHSPVTEIERAPLENVLRKAAMVQRDAEEQERIFKTFWRTA